MPKKEKIKKEIQKLQEKLLKMEIEDKLKELKKSSVNITHGHMDEDSIYYETDYSSTIFDAYAAHNVMTDELFFNLPVAVLVGWERYEDVVIHEFAKLVAWEMYDEDEYNGYKWKEIIKGLNAKQTTPDFHFAEFLPNNPKDKIGKIETFCGCQSIWITKNKATRMKKGTSSYVCKKCGGRLKIVN